MPHLKINFFLLLFFSSLVILSQTHKWHLLTQEHLGFQLEFYSQLVGNVTIDETLGFPIRHYIWESIVDEKEHENEKYTMEVFVFPDTLTGSPILSEYQEKIFLKQLYDSNNTLSGERNYKYLNGYEFESYIFLDKDRKRGYCQTGVVANKLYKLSYNVKDDGWGGSDGIYFVRSFQLINPPAKASIAGNCNPGFEINLSAIPECETHVSEDGRIEVLIALYKTSEYREKASVNDLIIGDDVIVVEDGFISPPTEGVTEKNPFERDGEEIVEYYMVTETRFSGEMKDELPDENVLYLEYQKNLINIHNGRLLDYETIMYDSYEGREMKIRSLDGDTYVYNIYLIDTTLYLIEVKLKFGAYNINDLIRNTLASFKLKNR